MEENETPRVSTTENKFELQQLDLPVNPFGDEVIIHKSDHGNEEGNPLSYASPQKRNEKSTQQEN